MLKIWRFSWSWTWSFSWNRGWCSCWKNNFYKSWWGWRVCFKTGVDSLAIAIGTSHGAHKFKPGTDPKLELGILAEIERRIPGFPIVLHGSSAVPQKYVEEIKKYGGQLKDAIGIPNSELMGAAKSGVAKINVDTDGRLAFYSWN